MNPNLRVVLQWRNGAWQGLYYENFFINVLKEHVKKVGGYKNKQAEERKILTEMAKGDTVIVNGLSFKFRKEKQQ
jgi:hypothetical protein